MIELPDLSQDFLWESNFYHSCDPARLGKILETRAVDDYLRTQKARIERLSFCNTPCYVVKK